MFLFYYVKVSWQTFMAADPDPGNCPCRSPSSSSLKADADHHAQGHGFHRAVLQRHVRHNLLSRRLRDNIMEILGLLGDGMWQAVAAAEPDADPDRRDIGPVHRRDAGAGSVNGVAILLPITFLGAARDRRSSSWPRSTTARCMGGRYRRSRWGYRARRRRWPPRLTGDRWR